MRLGGLTPRTGFDQTQQHSLNTDFAQECGAVCSNNEYAKMIEIKNRWSGAVIRVVDAANLRDADLRDADLRGADLCGADLCGADLRDADLRDADLRGADLCGADLRDADLRDADLRDANLCGADLRDAKNAPLVISGLRWVVQISGTGWMQIGCQRHSVTEWAGFDNDSIAEMDTSDALPFWEANKQLLMGLCAQHIHKEEKQEV